MAADASDLRRSAFLLLTAAAVAIAAAKTVGAENVYEPSRYKSATQGGYGYELDRPWPEKRPDPVPMFSSNDKSRWATVRALVHDKTYVIGKRLVRDDPKSDTGIVTESAYKSTDVVLNPDTQEFYSSKPPLMATIAAGEYWVLHRVFGWDIVSDRWLVIPAIVLTWNVIPFAVYLVLLGRLIDLTGKTDFGKLLAFTAAAIGTFLTTFSGTLNNHTPAAFCILFACYPLLKAIVENRDMTPAGYACCGFFGGFSATFERPALAFVAAVGLPLLARTRETLCCSSCRPFWYRSSLSTAVITSHWELSNRCTTSSAARGTGSRAVTGRRLARPRRRDSTSTTNRRRCTRSTCPSATTAGSA